MVYQMLSHQCSGLIILLYIYISHISHKHFRLIVIKYADRGLVQTGGLASKLFNQLYTLSTCAMTTLLSLMFLARIWRSIDDDDYFSQEEAFLLVERHLLYKIDNDQYITPETGNYFITNIYMFMIIFNVYYLEKQKSELRKRKFQRNIITFHTNTKFFMFFLWISLPVLILKSLSFQQPSTSRLVRKLLLSLHLIKLLVAGFLRPLVIIHLLKRNMPSFFTDSLEEPRIKSFYITGQSFQPRTENLFPFKPFCQNARWGWMNERTHNMAEIESKHEKEKILNLSCNIFHVPSSSNSMPSIDI